ncbi:phosphoesterase RecJ-like protein [Pseudonocardia hierapolitana]|uniref:Phosphoesterase RecJ-like protein n=1 Tax=Pseudonocardia hierapolitana TaxID=1128676 RepID=A0A561SHZ1_9PSEU|nr:DHH family phosphoesterase [Pseudonocardia hierapolitana]TWF74477.1 phosphoesterase RecJ-like protein [Pseudonocardia hierapolitana]
MSGVATVGAAVAEAAAVLGEAREVTLLAHVDPDADALGSALALGIALRRRGARVQVAFASPDRVPESLRPLDALGLLVAPAEVSGAPEVLVSCDAAEPRRLGSLGRLLDTAACTVMLDHHATNPGFGDVQVLDPGAEATVVIVHRVLVEMGAPIDADVARCLYAGLVTDTRGFRTAGPAAYRLAAELVEAGADPATLTRSLMDCHPFAWFGGLAGALGRAVLEPSGLLHTTIPLADVRRYRSEEIDSVVDVLRTAVEAEVVASVMQIEERRWRVSLRSAGRVDVAVVATALGGGGHAMAAGFTRDGTEQEVLAAIRAALTTE